MTDTALTNIRIVLVEPAGALNVGSIARILKNMGLHHLVLVNPQCDPLSDDALLMAVHAADVLAAAEIVQTLPEALKGCQRAIATTARARAIDTQLETPRAALPWLIAEAPVQSALIFGSEERGLSNEELKYAQRFVCIPSSPAYPSLNLAQAVAICCYELYQFGIDQPLANQRSTSQETVPLTQISNLASLDTLEGYYQHLEALLLKTGYLFPHTANSRMEKFRRLFNRAYLSTAEVSMLRGILSQVEWALEVKNALPEDANDRS